jgi:hypothetical protein
MNSNTIRTELLAIKENSNIIRAKLLALGGEMNEKIGKQEIVERIRDAVELVKKSGSPDANTACTARAGAIVKLLALIKDLNS